MAELDRVALLKKQAAGDAAALRAELQGLKDVSVRRAKELQERLLAEEGLRKSKEAENRRLVEEREYEIQKVIDH